MKFLLIRKYKFVFNQNLDDLIGKEFDYFYDKTLSTILQTNEICFYFWIFVRSHDCTIDLLEIFT